MNHNSLTADFLIIMKVSISLIFTYISLQGSSAVCKENLEQGFRKHKFCKIWRFCTLIMQLDFYYCWW